MARAFHSGAVRDASAKAAEHFSYAALQHWSRDNSKWMCKIQKKEKEEKATAGAASWLDPCPPSHIYTLTLLDHGRFSFELELEPIFFIL